MAVMFQNRQLIGFDDITGIQYECLRCHSKCIVPVKGNASHPQRCPGCGEVWFGAGRNATIDKFSEMLVQFSYINQMVGVLSEQMNLRITLEVENQEPEEEEKARR